MKTKRIICDSLIIILASIICAPAAICLCVADFEVFLFGCAWAVVLFACSLTDTGTRFVKRVFRACRRIEYYTLGVNS